MSAARNGALLLVAALAGASCRRGGSAAPPTTAATPAATTPAALAEPAAAAIAPPQEKSKIAPYTFDLEPKEVDLGTLRPDQDAKCEFTIVNTDARPMRVLNLVGSCDCTSFTFDRTEIPPGGRRVVHVVVHAQNRGAKRLYALVQAYDAPVTTKRIDLNYSVLAELAFTPTEVSFGRRVVGSNGSADVVVRWQQSASGPLVELLPKLSQDVPIHWKLGEPKTTEAAGVREVTQTLRLELDAQSPVAPFRAALVFESELQLPARLAVSGEVHPGWYLDPWQVQWATKPGAESRATVRLCWTTPDAPKVESVDTSDPVLTATATPEPGRRSTKIEVVFVPKQAGDFSGEVRVKIDRATEPLVIRCKATVR